MVIGVLSGSIPWYTMMILGRKPGGIFSKVDDTLGVFHTHAVAGSLGGILAGFFAQPTLCNLFLPIQGEHGAVYGGEKGGQQLGKQICAALFIIGWNVVVTSIICLVIKLIVPLRMSDKQLQVGDDAAHGEEAYALWGDGEKFDASKHSGTEYKEMELASTKV